MNILFFDRVCPGMFEFISSSLDKSRSNTTRFFGYQYDGDSFDNHNHNITYLELDATLTQKPLVSLTQSERAMLKENFMAAINKLPETDKPDLIVANASLGCTHDIKTILPSCKLVGFFPLYVNKEKLGDTTCQHLSPDRDRINEFNNIIDKEIEHCDVAITFSQWQRSLFPEQVQSKLEIFSQGALSRVYHPTKDLFFGLIKNKADKYALVGDHIYTQSDEVISYVVNGIEPLRKIETFAAIAQALLKSRPQCKIAILSQRGGQYGPADEDLLEQLAKTYELDSDRVHIQIPYTQSDALSLYKCSSIHVYLSENIPNEQSFYNALSTGALVIADDIEPVREIINDNETGLLFKSTDPKQMAAQINDVLNNLAHYDPIKNQAHKHIKKNYNQKHQILSLVRRLLKFSVLGR